MQYPIDMITCAYTELSILTICLFFVRFSVVCVCVCVWLHACFLHICSILGQSFTLSPSLFITSSLVQQVPMHIEYRTSKPLASVIFATHFKDCFDQFFLQCNSLKTGRFFLPLFWNNHLKNKNKIKHQQQRRWSKKKRHKRFGIQQLLYFIIHNHSAHKHVLCVLCKHMAGSILHVVYAVHNLSGASTCELEIFNRCSLDKRFPVARKYNRNLYSCWMFRLLVIAPPPPATIDSIHGWPAVYAIASDFVWMIVLMLVLVLMHTMDDIIWCIRWI